ncbi:MAG: hypothetical protein HXY23_12780 [Parvularculaceae bacterium]|jgi:hypothetical protein|nr:hypothetical protein [Parvularculaceae bacterium]
MFAMLAAALLAPADAPFLCVCSANAKPVDIEFEGVAVDAALVALKDGVGVEPRQATIFRVTRAFKGEAKTPMKVWHLTNPQRCGVKFNYAASYRVKARVKNGAVETDACLMPELKSAPATE